MTKINSASRILVVDDDESVRRLLTDLLVHDGYAVDTADSANAAIVLLLRHRYSLLITDLEMPIAGVELIEQVRARGLRLPILATSGNHEAMREAAVLAVHPAEYLAKPFSIGEVREAVTRLLSVAEAEDSDTPSPKRYSPD